MEKINGIIIDGKIYEVSNIELTNIADVATAVSTFNTFAMLRSCCCRVFEGGTTNKYTFRFSPELTDKLKGE